MEWAILFVTLCILEVILGLDNIFSFAMLVNQAPPASRKFSKMIALSGAFVLRVGFLFIALAIQDTHYPITLWRLHWSAKEAFLFFGGMFLILKALKELRHYHEPVKKEQKREKLSLSRIITEIIFVDLIFAIDSVLAAIAMTHDWVIITSAILSSVIFMYFAADLVIKYMDESWRFNVLGMILIIFIGLFLMGKGLGIKIDQHVIISTIIFGCVYEGYMTYLDARRKHH